MTSQRESSVPSFPSLDRSSCTAGATDRQRRRVRPYLRAGIALLFSLLPLTPLTAATITVTTLEDGSIADACTLRDALLAAGDDTPHSGCAAGATGVDEIVFADGLTGILALTEGQLEATLPAGDGLSVIGPGSGELTLDAQGVSRVLEIFGDPSSKATMSGLTVTGGRTVEESQGGGGIRCGTVLELIDVVVTGNSTAGRISPGGGLFTATQTDLTNSVVSGNWTEGEGSNSGGVIVVFGAANVTDSSISGNWTEGDTAGGGGLVVFINFFDANITNSTIADNATFGDNSQAGGYAHGGNTFLTNSTVSGNSTSGADGFAGGIRVSGNITILNSTVVDNSSVAGVDGIEIVETGAVSGTGPAFGGGIALAEDLLTSPPIQRALRAGGGTAVHQGEGEEVIFTVANSLIAQADGDAIACSKPINGPGSTHNLATDATCGTDTLVDGTPVTYSELALGPLADNGGTGPTHALLSGSVAIDAADATVCGGAPVDGRDQRGGPRPLDGTGDGNAACDVGSFEAGLFAPVALAVDPQTVDSDGNGVFEPGEQVDVMPLWRNDGVAATALTGDATAFEGPPGGLYTLDLAAADYGLVEPGGTTSCEATEICYRLGVDDPAPRPATHWEAQLDEALSDGTVKTWSLHIGASFVDVPPASPFYPAVETLLHHGVTEGCGDTTYCPGDGNTRGQMAVFLLRAAEGDDHTPSACVDGDERFADVSFDHPLCPWIEELAERGVTSGCGGGDYCPGDSVTRGQMSVFLLRALEGGDYEPSGCTAMFSDVPCSSTFAAWIEELAGRDITSGCSVEPPAYCPAAPVTRAQMAVFVTRTFGLDLYGP